MSLNPISGCLSREAGWVEEVRKALHVAIVCPTLQRVEDGINELLMKLKYYQADAKFRQPSCML